MIWNVPICGYYGKKVSIVTAKMTAVERKWELDLNAEGLPSYTQSNFLSSPTAPLFIFEKLIKKFVIIIRRFLRNLFYFLVKDDIL